MVPSVRSSVVLAANAVLKSAESNKSTTAVAITPVAESYTIPEPATKEFLALAVVNYWLSPSIRFVVLKGCRSITVV